MEPISKKSHCLLKSPALGTYKPLQDFRTEAIMVHATSSKLGSSKWRKTGWLRILKLASPSALSPVAEFKIWGIVLSKSLGTRSCSMCDLWLGHSTKHFACLGRNVLQVMKKPPILVQFQLEIGFKEHCLQGSLSPSLLVVL